jgi:putative two-component system response regulator
MLPKGSAATEELPLVLIVDDAPEILATLVELLRPYYRTRVANSGDKALLYARTQERPNLILLDVLMPSPDGYEVCRRLKENPATASIPVIFLTGRAEVEDEKTGFDLGAVDFVTKPIQPPSLLARIRTHLALERATRALREHSEHLEAEVARRTAEVAAIQDVTIVALASLAETRDNETGNHIRRTQCYVRALANELKSHPKFSEFLTPETIERLYKSAPLHDIGKVGVPDHILLKPGKLTPEEFTQMKLHAAHGRDAIARAEEAVGHATDFLRFAKEIAYCHHEKWDGSGYPQGLAGEAIPLSARLMAVADVYDALISKRVYKPAFTHDHAVGIIREGRGAHFDPTVIDAFVAICDEFEQIAKQYADH